MKTLTKLSRKTKMGLSALGLSLMATASHAADTVGIQAGIDAAKADAVSVGDMVLIALAALVVVGMIVRYIRKLG